MCWHGINPLTHVNPLNQGIYVNSNILLNPERSRRYDLVQSLWFDGLEGRTVWRFDQGAIWSMSGLGDNYAPHVVCWWGILSPSHNSFMPRQIPYNNCPPVLCLPLVGTIAPSRWRRVFSTTLGGAGLVRSGMTWGQSDLQGRIVSVAQKIFSIGVFLYRGTRVDLGNNIFWRLQCINACDSVSIPEAYDVSISPDRRHWFKILKRPLISAVDLLVRSRPLIVKRR